MKGNESLQWQESYRIFLDYFNSQFSEGEKQFADFGSLIDWDRGLEILDDYRERTDSIAEATSRNILLFSLLDRLPDAVVINQNATVFEDGLFVDCLSKSGELYRRTLSYNADVAEKLRLFMLFSAENIEEAMRISKEYFLNWIKNSSVSDFELMLVNMGCPCVERIIRDVGDELPIIEVVSGENIAIKGKGDNRAKAMVFRELFRYVFSDEGAGFFDDVEAVLFHYNAFFVLKDGEVVMLPVNERYEELFIKPNKQHVDAEKKRLEKVDDYKVRRRTELKIREEIQAQCRAALESGSVPLSSYEIIITKIEELYNFKVSVRDLVQLEKRIGENYSQYLSVFLDRYGSLLGRFVTCLDFFLNRELEKCKTNSEVREVYLRKNQQRLFTEKGVYEALGIEKELDRQKVVNAFDLIDKRRRGPQSSQSEGDMSYEDIRLLGEMGESYRPFMDAQVLLVIFKSLLSVDDKSKIEAFKNIIGVGNLEKLKAGFEGYGFDRNHFITELAVMMHLFVRYGVLYMDEFELEADNSKLPEVIRRFFDDILGMRRSALE